MLQAKFKTRAEELVRRWFEHIVKLEKENLLAKSKMHLVENDPKGLEILSRISWKLDQDPRKRALIFDEYEGDEVPLSVEEWNASIFTVSDGEGMNIWVPTSRFEFGQHKLYIPDENGAITIGNFLSAIYHFYNHEYLLVHPIQMVGSFASFKELDTNTHGMVQLHLSY